MVMYRPHEREMLEYIQGFVGSHPAAGDDLMSMFLGTMGGAQERFEENRQMRSQGLQGLREMALQLAASGASEEAVSGALTGQASGLPLMGPRYGGENRIEGLESFVGGLYGEGPVSGLAPLEMRDQTGVIDDDDRAAIDGMVNQLMGQGTDFTTIREQVRRQFISQGYNEFSTSEAEAEAQSAYERLMGGSLEEMRGVGAGLREGIGDSQEQNLRLGDILDATDFTEEQLMGSPGLIQEGEGQTVKGFMARLVNDPQLYGQLSSYVGEMGGPGEQPQPMQMPRPSQPSFGLPRGGASGPDPYGLGAYTRR